MSRPSSSLCKKDSGLPSTREQNAPGHDDTPAQEAVGAEDARSLAGMDRPPTELDATSARPPKTYHPFSPAVIALLMPASVFGALARLGLQALATYDGRSIFPLAYPQAIGCFIMGLALPLKDTINNYHSPLYTAITTGFCGSLTTFSGWQLDIFYSWINEGRFHRNGLRDVVDGCTKIFFTLSISLASLSFGIHIGTSLVSVISKVHPPSVALRRAISLVSVLLYFATIPTYFCLSASFRHQATAALLFSFPGTLTRYVLSILLNPRTELLPIGTLVANELGTSLLALFHALQGLSHPVSPGACSILQGLADGYCGCLTTVSTFAAEMSALVVWKRWLYGTVSIVMGQVLMVVILGSTIWTGNASAGVHCMFTGA